MPGALGSCADTADSLAVSAGLISPPRNRFNPPNNAPTAPAHCRMSSSRSAKRSGLVFGFVGSSKTSEPPSHKRRLTSWAPPRNDPNRPWPNCLMSSTRRAKRSAFDFVGFVIVISKNPLTDRAPARRHDCVGQRAGLRAFRLRPVVPPKRGRWGWPQKSLAQIFCGFSKHPCAVRISRCPNCILGGGSGRPSRLHFSIQSIPLNAGRMRLSASTAGVLDLDCGAAASATTPRR